MSEFEYRLEEVYVDELVDYLNGWGGAGWEVVAIIGELMAPVWQVVLRRVTVAY